MNIEPVVYGLMTLFGIPYAIYIFHNPMRRVWVSVAIGCSVVSLGQFILNLERTGDIWFALSPFLLNLFAGIWQIIAQEVKKFHTEALADKIIEDAKQSSEGEPYELWKEQMAE